MRFSAPIGGLGDAGTRDRAISGAGIGLRTCHIERVLTERPPVPWFELLADNHLATGGLVAAQLEALRDHYALTLHCVDMNLGGCDALDLDYVSRVRDLRDRCGALLVSDHLCFTAVDGRHYHDLLPIPYTGEALTRVAGRVQAAQDLLQQPLVLENVSSYLRFAHSDRSEAEFLAELCSRTGCLLLLDLNNLYVNQVNHGEDPADFLQALPLDRVAEIHLGGYETMDGYLLDAHNNPVSEPVWRLYELACGLLPEVPVLIEWDNDIPDFDLLREQAELASDIARRSAPGVRTAYAGAGGMG